MNGTTNRLAGTATYDAGGNLLSWNGNAYDYDRFNMLTDLCTSGTLGSCSGERWSYVYTADDERIWSLKSDNRQIFVARGFGNEVLTRDERSPSFVPGGLEAGGPGAAAGPGMPGGGEEIGPMGIETRWVDDYVWRGDKLVGTRAPGATGGVHYGLDHLGTVRLRTNSAGMVTSRHAHFPFGREALSTAATRDPMRFTGHERDLQTTTSDPADDLDYLHARFSSPITGRFLSVDPVMQLGRSQRMPQLWNRYAYALGNPLGYVDPSGLLPQPSGIPSDRDEALSQQGDCGFSGAMCLLRGFIQLFLSEPQGPEPMQGIEELADEIGLSESQQEHFDQTAFERNALTGLNDATTEIGARSGDSLIAAGLVKGGGGRLGARASTGSVRPSPNQIAKFERQLAEHGAGSLLRSQRSLERRLGKHLTKLGEIRSAGGYTSSVEKEIANFGRELEAIRQVLGGAQ